MSQTRWWTNEAWNARKPHLLARIRARQAIAGFFAAEGFLEVETPALQRSPGLEPHLMAFATRAEAPGGKTLADLYLHTSPEFAMKKLLAAGAGNIFQFARVFRNREGSATHHPEFTLLEWYRVGCDYRRIMDDTIAVVRAAAAAAGAGARLRWRGRECDPVKEWEQISVAGAFQEYAGIDLAESLGDGLAPDTKRFAEQAKSIGIGAQAGDAWDDIFFRIFLEKIEAKLGVGAPTILFDYPACMAALSRRKASDPRFAERFEVYACGMELANAFSELTDPKEQRTRFEADMEKKAALYGIRYPIDEDFLAAVGELPECAGIALGFDRLVMLMTGAADIRDVLFAPVFAAKE